MSLYLLISFCVYLAFLSRYFSYLNTATTILRQYKGQEPFPVFIKQFFSAGKKYGSGDRRAISQLCYSYFRASGFFPAGPDQDSILQALFLCADQPNPVLEALAPDWSADAGTSLEDKLSILRITDPVIRLFPFNEPLSNGIDNQEFAASHLIQPDLFLRIRPGHLENVTNKLGSAGIGFLLTGEDCLVLPNGSKLEDILEVDQEAVIQDLSSQRVGDLIKLIPANSTQKIRVWDCCAASGGKSILAWDVLGELELTVTDIRESILANLRKRFQRAGIKQYQSATVDLEKNVLPGDGLFDLLITDVPCSGSGTWGRSPEQLCFFDPDMVNDYARRQQLITRQAVQRLAPGGYFLYITCSVFKRENEAVVDHLIRETKLQLIQSRLLEGYREKADTMFAALLQLPL